MSFALQVVAILAFYATWAGLHYAASAGLHHAFERKGRELKANPRTRTEVKSWIQQGLVSGVTTDRSQYSGKAR
jgi:hypothetical protein